MIASVRKKFNDQFSEEKYNRFIEDIESVYNQSIVFRQAETPVFVPRRLKEQMLDACEQIIDVITQPGFKASTEKAIPDEFRVPGENDHADFLVLDFGVCKDESGELAPRLIEMQGFPTLFCWQALLSRKFKEHFDIPSNLDSYLDGADESAYIENLRKIMVADAPVEEVILLEIRPHEQKTRIDFYCTLGMLGVRPVCISEITAEGDKLYYDRDGVKTRISRIYNRLIFDDLVSQQERLGPIIDLKKDYDVTWVSHPNWFYRISKYTLPFLKGNPYVPETTFLHELPEIPADLENYVLKPLFSFAGQGVIIDVTPEDIESIADRENWILQKKVNYIPVIETPDQPAKCEIRIIYFWEKGADRPVAVQNLSRLSKGKMIGVRYNADFTWVGGTVCFMEK